MAFRADSSGSPTASFKLDRIGAFVHAMTSGSIAQAAIHASTSSRPGTKLFDLDPLLNDDRHIDYFVAPRDAQALSKNTKYYVVFSEGGGDNDSYKLYVTAKTTEDTEADSGWPIDDAGFTKDEGRRHSQLGRHEIRRQLQWGLSRTPDPGLRRRRHPSDRPAPAAR